MKKNNFNFTLAEKDYQILGLRIINITINNKFHYSHLIEEKNPSLIPKKGHITVEATCLEQEGEAYQALRRAAFLALPLKSHLLSDEGLDVTGTFFISDFNLEEKSGDLSEISFKMVSSGSYEIQ
jgi:hypothetical protein